MPKTPKKSAKAKAKATRQSAALVNKAAATAKSARKKPAEKPPAVKPPTRKPPAPIVSTGLWLLKSEPDVFSWDMLKARGDTGEPWTGVRNYLARNNMRAMKLGDLAFFYHSNIGKEIVGIAKVSALAHPDRDDDTGTWDCVDVVAVVDLPKPVTLADVKANPNLSDMSLVTAMRLSVQPVTPQQWNEVCRMAGLEAAHKNWSPGGT